MLFEDDACFVAFPQDGVCSGLPCSSVFFECRETGVEKVGEGGRERFDGRGEGGSGLVERDKGGIRGVGEGSKARGEVMKLCLERDGFAGEFWEGQGGEMGQIRAGERRRLPRTQDVDERRWVHEVLLM